MTIQERCKAELPFLTCNGQQPHSVGSLQTTPPYQYRRASSTQMEEHCNPQRGIGQLCAEIQGIHKNALHVNEPLPAAGTQTLLGSGIFICNAKASI